MTMQDDEQQGLGHEVPAELIEVFEINEWLAACGEPPLEPPGKGRS